MDTHAGGPRLRELALFAGAGGGIWASRWLLGWRTVGYVEIDRYCQRVLRARIRDGLFDDAPIWDDIKTFDGKPWRGRVDVITAGFPCQPFSSAGKQRGESDDRNMWPDTARIVREVQPRFVFLENVAGLLDKSHGYFGRVLGDLASMGYDAEWTVLGADDVGAPHHRKRLWILANTQSDRWSWPIRSHLKDGKKTVWPTSQSSGALDPRLSVFEEFEKRLGEPAVLGMDDGLANRINRLGASGSGQVPFVAACAWDELLRRMTCENGEMERS